MKLKKNQSKIKVWIKGHKVISIILIISVILLLLLFSARIILYINLLLGNDVIISLQADKEALQLIRGQQENISFTAKVTTNPFCKAICTATFYDISKNQIVSKKNFTLNPGNPITKTFTITENKLGSGQELYRFDMDCRGITSTFCQTSGNPITRSILITANYHLSEDEKSLKDYLQKQLISGVGEMEDLKGKYLVLQYYLDDLNKTIKVNHSAIDLPELKNTLNDGQKKLLESKEIWNGEDYSALSDKVKDLNSELTQAQAQYAEKNTKILDIIFSYNHLTNEIKTAREIIIEIEGEQHTDNPIILDINNSVEDFNNAVLFFMGKNSIEDKEKAIIGMADSVVSLKLKNKNYIRNEVLKRELETDIAYDSLCQVAGTCISHTSIEQRAMGGNYSPKKSCEYSNQARKLFLEINRSIYPIFINQSYPGDLNFKNNISQKITNLRYDIISTYYSQIPYNAANNDIIYNILNLGHHIETEIYPNYNLTPALEIELMNLLPNSCDIINASYQEITALSPNKIELKDEIPVPINIVFNEQPMQCCVFGRCEPCCLQQECHDDPSLYPVVFLHGHAVNKDVSAEYSLEGFNKIQDKLEEDGYLSAGAITLYSERETSGLWGLPNVPLTVRASYYFDFFKEPENYIVVQTKSENIDTYAVRIKELVDTIKYKTAKPKVNIVAFSMGGLVTRRYLQIFGTEDVNMAILIGSPNHGIYGRISDYCPIIGEKRECSDMNSDSIFINKLNAAEMPQIPVINIIGTGCKMNEGMGDGIVLEDSAWLEGANNYVINGTCRSTTKPLHLELRDIDLYPEVYNIIKGNLMQ